MQPVSSTHTNKDVVTVGTEPALVLHKVCYWDDAFSLLYMPHHMYYHILAHLRCVRYLPLITI
jgi:hypothetical protein